MFSRPVDASNTLPTYLHSEVNLHQWLFPSGKVSLIKCHESLEYILEAEGKKIRGPIPTPSDVDLEDCIAFLTSCEPIVVDESVSFIPPVSRWKIDEGEICLIQKDGQLETIWIHHDGIRTCQSSHLTDETIQHIATCQPVIQDGKIVFYSIYHSWTWNDHKVALLKDSQLQLIWHVFNQKTLKTNYLSYLQGTVFEGIEDRPVGEIKLDYLNEFKIEKLVVEKKDNSEIMKTIFLKTITFCSKFDANVILNCNCWALTLVNTGKVNNMNPMTWYGHAGLVIEGVKNGAYFSYFTDLIAQDGGKVRFEDRTVAYSGKSVTFFAVSFQVERMITAIKKEIAQQEKGEPIVRFSAGKVTPLLARSEAFLKGKGNSLAPTCQKIKTYDSYQEMVENILECSPGTLDACLWDNQESEYSWSLRETLYMLIEGKNKEEAKREVEEEIVMNTELCDLKVATEEEISRLIKIESTGKIEKFGSKDENGPYYSVLLIDRSKKHLWIESNNPRIRYYGNDIKSDEYQELIAHRVVLEEENGKWVEVVEPHNCLSWIAVKIKPLGLYIENFSSDWKPYKHAQKDGVKFNSSALNLADRFESIQIIPPHQIQVKALKQDIEYLEKLRVAIKDSKEIPERPKITVQSLVSIEEPLDPYVLLWLASLHDTPGITLEICTYFKKACQIYPETLAFALLMAVTTESVKEIEILIIYFEIQTAVDTFPNKELTAIDYVLSNPTSESGLDAFITILQRRKVDFRYTRIAKDMDFLKSILTELENKKYFGVIFMLNFFVPIERLFPDLLSRLKKTREGPNNDASVKSLPLHNVKLAPQKKRMAVCYFEREKVCCLMKFL